VECLRVIEVASALENNLLPAAAAKPSPSPAARSHLPRQRYSPITPISRHCGGTLRPPLRRRNVLTSTKRISKTGKGRILDALELDGSRATFEE
jgi:hypothetical protein